MNDNWKFSALPYTSPDVEALQARYDALTQRAKDAQDPEDLLEVVRQRDALQQEVALCQSIATIRAFHDVTDEFYQRELQETLPRLETLDTQSLSMAIADSPYAAAVDETFGPQLRRLLTLDQRLHTGGKELLARISRLTAQYQQLAASTKYQVQGETLSGGQLRFALTSTDRERRKAARRMYHALSPEAGRFFDEMVRHDLLDVAGSPNKISGMGFCDMLGAPCGMPFIFANCDGTGSDVTVYTHELGHGLQGYLSYRSQPLADYVGLSPDLAEVHSKTMELLTLPYARDFFGPHAPQFLTEHRYDFIKELCAFCSIHTFETWLYEHPDASLSQWAEEFDRTEKAFGRAQNNEPWRQQVLAGCDLFTNMAIYMLPRYVVSYALSIVCAQQLKAAYDADPVDGWARYHALCASGGSKLYAETLAAAGLELPYAPGVVERLARELAAQA